MYLSYPQTGYGSHQLQNIPGNYGQHDQHSARGSIYEPRASYDISSQMTVGSRQPPTVTSFNPHQGTSGTSVTVYLQSSFDLQLRSSTGVNLMFANSKCPTTVTRLANPGPELLFCVWAKAPPHSSTLWSSPSVPLRVSVDGEFIDVGSFLYTDNIQQHIQPELQRKRKFSDEALESMRLPNKRPSSAHLYSSPSDVASIYGHDSSGYSHSQPATPGYGGGSLGPSPHLQSQSTFSTRSQLGLGNSNLSHARASSAQSSPWAPSFRSPGLVQPTSRMRSFSSPTGSNPSLVRTSTIQQSHGNSSSRFNPYVVYPRKAVLKLNGDLDSMTERWSPEEWSAKRRLVQFWRSQNGSTIDADFAPTNLDNGPPKGIVISCIWWEERNECFVTSVDTIYLLESLVAVRFTVEEKNRIRRNLEGFRPMTVSKAKLDSEEFFKVIMGFPNPKPRNIEKDVKVFPWKILAPALKKIISKYVSFIPTHLPHHPAHLLTLPQSASYSSTASLISTPRQQAPTSAYAQSDTGLGSSGASLHSTDPYAVLSPRSSASSTSYQPGAHHLPSTTLSPIMSHQRTSVPAPGPSPYYGDAASTPPMPHHSYSMSTYPHEAPAPGHHQTLDGTAPRNASWDIGAYIDPAVSGHQVESYDRRTSHHSPSGEIVEHDGQHDALHEEDETVVEAQHE